MALEEKTKRLENALECLKSAYDSTSAEQRLTDLLRFINSGAAQGPVYEEYGRLEHKLNQFQELFEYAEIAVYMLNDASRSKDQRDTATATEEADKCLDDIKDFILGQKFTGKYDQNNAILTIQLGTVAGVDVAPFMHNLITAYIKFAKKNDFTIEEIDFDNTRDCTIECKGQNAYAYFHGEHGVHRIIYMDRRGKKQTGYLTVIVEPELEDPPIKLEEKELQYEQLAATGPGGQHTNRSHTGIRITHLPTGISALSRRRSQNNNVKVARKILASRIVQHYAATKGDPVGKERISPVRGGYHIRTYSITGEQFIKDHRTGVMTSDLKSFFDGNIEDFIAAYHGLPTGM